MEAEDPAPPSRPGPPAPGAPVDPAELDRAEAELGGVEDALERLDAGTYGACEVCGRPIGDDRLAADATTRRCADHG